MIVNQFLLEIQFLNWFFVYLINKNQDDNLKSHNYKSILTAKIFSDRYRDDVYWYWNSKYNKINEIDTRVIGRGNHYIWQIGESKFLKYHDLNGRVTKIPLLTQVFIVVSTSL